MSQSVKSPEHATGVERRNHSRHPRHNGVKHRADKGPKRSAFDRFARLAARIAGEPIAFGIAVVTIIFWAASGPVFHFNDTWQLVINTATTIATFLMVFLIQNTQNRDSEAVQLKLDELIRATKTAHNALLQIEELSEKELDEIKTRYAELAREARREVRTGESDLGTPETGKKEV